MRKARKILRLKYEMGLGVREISRSVGVSHGTVINYLKRAEAAGLGWPLVDSVDDTELQRLLFESEDEKEDLPRGLPPMAEIHKALCRSKSVTLLLLWEEYRSDHPQGYGYTQFCEYYRRHKRTLSPVLRQPYTAGEKLFVDWAGETLTWTDSKNGEVHPAYLFVATHGASNYTYVEAFADMQLPSWVDAHIHAWEFFGGVTAVTVPDNLKTGVIKSCSYEPTLNRTYEELAEHYGTVVIPARARKPQDKAKVEAAVQHAERRIIAALRDQTFFGLGELNRAIRVALNALNERPFQKMHGCRRALFDELDRPALKALPARRYDLGTWRTAKVNIDYHVQVDKHLYSVPYGLVNESVEVRLSARTVECFHRAKRVAVHARSSEPGQATTDPAHRPKSHQKHLEWTPGRLIHWARNEVGVRCAEVMETIMQSKPHPEQGYRACLGLMRLSRQYGDTRLEAASARAITRNACSFQSIKSILATGLDRRCEDEQSEDALTPTSSHQNIRGHDYYAERHEKETKHP